MCDNAREGANALDNLRKRQMIFGGIVFFKLFVISVRHEGHFAMKVTSAAVHVLILIIGFNTAPGFGNKQCMSSTTCDVIVSLIRGCVNIPVAERTNRHRSAIVRFWRNRDTFQLDGKTLLFDGKVAHNGDLATFVKTALTSTKGSGARKLNIRLQSATVSRAKIQHVLDRSEMYQLLKARFTNRTRLHPLEQRGYMIVIMAKLIDMSKWPVQHDGKTFRYILSVIDVFIGYLWLTAKQGLLSESQGTL